eukprot:9542428-Lingulodinium_polyedra.AAC.1
MPCQLDGASAGLRSVGVQGPKTSNPPAMDRAPSCRMRALRRRDEDRPLAIAPAVAVESTGCTTLHPSSPGRRNRFSTLHTTAALSS